jgi:carboxyl-terminal processing protease
MPAAARDDGLQAGERSLGAELAAEQSRKSARDVLLDEAARIMGDVVELTRSGTAVASKRTAGVSTTP